MAIIKRKNKKFDYKPRYYKGEGNPYAIKHKFDEFRSSTGSDSGLKGKINGAISDLKGEQNILKIDDETYQLVFVFFYIIDFDLSIFLTK